MSKYHGLCESLLKFYNKINTSLFIYFFFYFILHHFFKTYFYFTEKNHDYISCFAIIPYNLIIFENNIRIHSSSFHSRDLYDSVEVIVDGETIYCQVLLIFTMKDVITFKKRAFIWTQIYETLGVDEIFHLQVLKKLMKKSIFEIEKINRKIQLIPDGNKDLFFFLLN